MEKNITRQFVCTSFNVISAILHIHFIKKIEPFGSLSLGDLFSAVLSTPDRLALIVVTTIICSAMPIISLCLTWERFATLQYKNISFADKLYNIFSNISECPTAFITSLIFLCINIIIFCIMFKYFIVVLVALVLLIFVFKSLFQCTYR